MALAKIKKGDSVKIISGNNKGKVAVIQAVLRAKNAVLLAGIGERKRHYAANRASTAGKRDIQVPIALSNVALVVEAKTNKTSRVGVLVKPSGDKSRLAKSLKNKEIK